MWIFDVTPKKVVAVAQWLRLVPCESGFNQLLLVAIPVTGGGKRAHGQNCSCSPVKVLLILVGTSLAHEQGSQRN